MRSHHQMSELAQIYLHLEFWESIKNCETIISTHNLFCLLSLKSFFQMTLDFIKHQLTFCQLHSLEIWKKIVDIFKGRTIAELQENKSFTMY